VARAVRAEQPGSWLEREIRRKTRCSPTAARVVLLVGRCRTDAEEIPRMSNDTIASLIALAVVLLGGLALVGGVWKLEALLGRWARRRWERARRAEAAAALRFTDEGLSYTGEGETRTIHWDEIEAVEFHESNIFWDADDSEWWLVGAPRDGRRPVVMIPDGLPGAVDRLFAACAAHLPDFDEGAHRRATAAGVFHVPQLATVTYWRRSDRGVSVIYWYHRKEDGRSPVE
jgi:hypothetical protein